MYVCMYKYVCMYSTYIPLKKDVVDKLGQWLGLIAVPVRHFPHTYTHTNRSLASQSMLGMYMYVCMYVCIYICMYMYVCM